MMKEKKTKRVQGFLEIALIIFFISAAVWMYIEGHHIKKEVYVVKVNTDFGTFNAYQYEPISECSVYKNMSIEKLQEIVQEVQNG